MDRLARESDEIDIGLSDVTMPEMGGIDLTYQIREQYPDMPIALESGDVDSDCNAVTKPLNTVSSALLSPGWPRMPCRRW